MTSNVDSTFFDSVLSSFRAPPVNVNRYEADFSNPYAIVRCLDPGITSATMAFVFVDESADGTFTSRGGPLPPVRPIKAASC